MLLNTFDSMWRKKNSADYFHGNKFSAWYNDELYQLLQSDEKKYVTHLSQWPATTRTSYLWNNKLKTTDRPWKYLHDYESYK